MIVCYYWTGTLSDFEDFSQYMISIISMISMISMILSVFSWFPFVEAYLRSFSFVFVIFTFSNPIVAGKKSSQCEKSLSQLITPPPFCLWRSHFWPFYCRPIGAGKKTFQCEKSLAKLIALPQHCIYIYIWIWICNSF